MQRHLLCFTLVAFWLLTAGYGQQARVDFLTGAISIRPDPADRSVTGSVDYTFQTVGRPDSIRLDARDMTIEGVRLNGEEVPFKQDEGQLRLPAPEAEGIHRIHVGYKARPTQTVYFIGWDDSMPDNEQIWTQGQGKYSSHWVPSFDDMREKVVFDLEILAAPQYAVIANGRLRSRDTTGVLTRWDFDMEAPMSSYLLAFAIGKFEDFRIASASGVPIRLFFPKGRREEARTTYSHTREVFDFLEQEIGLPFPWQTYKQVPLRDFLYAGMENTGATFFSDAYLVDSIGNNDRSYLNVNAHELAHQWFGNLVTETDGGQHWLHEGFATFYAYQAEGEILGQRHMFWTLYRTASALRQLDADGEGESLLNPGAGSLTFYEKGAWALFALREALGDDAFRIGMRTYLETFAFDNATVSGFLDIMGTSGLPLDSFREDWLESEHFPWEQAEALLRKYDESLAYYLDFIRETGETADSGDLDQAWEAFEAPAYRAALLTRYANSFSREQWERAFEDTRIEVRKAWLSSLGPTEPWMLPHLEELLQAPSYEIREAALYRLWTEFPENRARYLDRTAAPTLLQAPALRQLWLLLALLTEGYATPVQAREYLSALRATTGPGYAPEVRENGFLLLNQVDALGRDNLLDLLRATEHHSWQFRLFARRMLDDLMAARPERGLWESLASDLPKQQYAYVYDKIAQL
ncbi:M1 family metallopeptidase [Robiginitalea sp. SC105]|uniref:M1 family metallopeptidase n=1 Tax=Robiginitalea sp. SC105 TaxID=2762332 RepID=UPI00163A10F1|nr:M1 family metallopeptidase [Robiginitalea sp. SC105]